MAGANWGGPGQVNCYGVHAKGDSVNLEDLGGKIAGELEVLFHHPFRHAKDYHLWINDSLCRSSWPTEVDLEYFMLSGINYMVNFCAEREQDELVKQYHMIPVNLPTVDTQHPTIEHAEQFRQIKGKKDGHCNAGHGRTDCFFAYLLIKDYGWTPEQAVQNAIGHLEPNQKEWILAIK